MGNTKERRQRLFDQGLCVSCGKAPHDEGARRCRPCLEKQKLASKKFLASHPGLVPTRKQRASEGLCPECGKIPEPGYKMCRGCQEKAVIKQRARKTRLKAAGMCVCGRSPVAAGKKMCIACGTEKRDLHRQRVASGRCSCCGGERASGRKMCSGCLAAASESVKQTHAALKEMILDHYGAKCSCCGEDRLEFMTVDHVNGGGTKHRRDLGGGTAVYRWIVKNNFPEGFRVLCQNCNWGRRFSKDGLCPHERERQAEATKSEEMPKMGSEPEKRP